VSLDPQVVFTDSAVAMTYSPVAAAISVNTGRLEGGLCVMELHNIQRWKLGGIAPGFLSNPIYPISTAVKTRDSAAAMQSYEPL